MTKPSETIQAVTPPEHYAKIVEMFLEKYEKLDPKAVSMICDYVQLGIHPRWIFLKDNEKLV